MTKSLSSILEQLSSKDIKQRLQGATNIVDYLKSGGEVEPDLLGDVVDALNSGINNSNAKISQSSITAARELLAVFDEDFKPHIHVLLPSMIDKMGDGKAGVRDEVQEFLQPAMRILSVDLVFDKVLPLFKDKNWRSREQALICLVATIGTYGITDLPQQAILANIIKVLEDPHQAVRDTAVLAVQEMYRELGEPLRAWLQQQNLRPTLLTLIQDKLNAIEPSAPLPSPPPTRAASAGGMTHTHSAPTRAQTPNAPPATLSRSSSGSSVFSAGSGESERSKSGSPKSMARKLKSPKPGTERLAGGGGETKIIAIRVNSEKELTKELEDISHTLISQGDDWDRRVKALQRLQGVALGNGPEFPTFLPLLQRLLRDPLATQVADLRSAVSKEACATLTTLSAVMGDAFEPLADNYVDVLLKCTIVTIQVISDSANKCIRAIIKQSRINRGVSKLTEGAANKNGIIRSRCMEYILLLLGVASTSTLEKYTDQIETAVKNGLTDAVGEVRAAARSSFIVFSRHWEMRSTKLLATLEPHTRKLIVEEMHRDDPLATTSSFSTPSREMSSSGERPGSSAKSRAPQRASSTERSRTPGAASRVPHRADPSPAPASAPPTRKLPERVDNTTPTFPTKHAHATTPHAEHANGRPPSSTGKRPPSSQGSALMPPPAHPPSHAPSRVLRDESSDTSSTDSYTETHAPPPQPQLTNVAVSASIPPEFREFVNLDLAKLFMEAENSLWSTRTEVFVTLYRLIVASVAPGFPPSAFPQTYAPRIAKLILDRMGDPHAKVVKAALDCLYALASHYPQPLVPFLDRILPPMFVRLSGLKDEPKSQASAVLSALLLPLRGSALLTSVLRVMDVLPPKPRGAALEYMLHLIAASSDYLTYPPHMRAMVHKILVAIGVATVGATGGGVSAPGMSLSLADPAQVGQIPPDLRRAGVQCLVELYGRYRPQFLAQLLPMPVSVQFEVKKLLASCQVNVDADLAAGAGNKAFSLPPPSSTAPLPVSANGKRPPSRNNEMEIAVQEVTDADYLARPPSGELLTDRTNPIPNMSNLSINPPTTKPKTSTTTTTATKPGLSNSGGRTSSSARAPSPLPPPSSSSSRPPPAVSNAPTHSTPPPNGNLSASGKKDDKQASLTKRKPNKPTSPPPVTSATPTKPAQKAQPDVALALTSVAQAGDADTRREGLHRLVKLMREDPDLLRSSWFEQILLSLLECLRDADPAMRELALVVLSETVKASSLPGGPVQSTTPFEPFINVTLSHVVETFRDKDNPHVKQAAEEAMDHLLKVLDPMKCCAVLVAQMQSEDGAVLQACVRYLAKCASALHRDVLRAQLHTMLPGLFEAFKNANADVRKAVVFCLVDLYMVLGDDLVPFLSSLTTSQKKLVTIYINRAKNKSPSPSSSDALGMG